MTTATIPANGAAQIEGLTNVEDIVQVGEAIKMFVQGQGQATKDEVRLYCTKALGVTTAVYQKAWAILHDQAKITTEVAREDGKKAFQIKRQVHVVPLADLLELVDEAKSPAKKRENYGDWFEVAGTMTLVTSALGSRPVIGNQSARQFIHTADGRIVLTDRNFEAMIERACQMPGAPEGIGNARFKIKFDSQLMPRSEHKELCPVPPPRPGERGQGITEVEALPPGTAIPFRAVVPGSHLTREAFEQVMEIAGRWCGFSPSAAHQGWGRFTVTFS